MGLRPALSRQVYSGLLNVLFGALRWAPVFWGLLMGCGAGHPKAIPTCLGLWGPSLQPTQGTEGISLPVGPWAARPTASKDPSSWGPGAPQGCSSSLGLREAFPTRRTQGETLCFFLRLHALIFCVQTIHHSDLNFHRHQALSPHVSRSVPRPCTIAGVRALGSGRRGCTWSLRRFLSSRGWGQVVGAKEQAGAWGRAGGGGERLKILA